MTSVTKTCNVCAEVKLLDRFGGKLNRCRDCQNRIRRERRAADRLDPRKFAGMYPISNKRCRCCSQVFPISNFHFDRKSKDAFLSYCKPCSSVKNREAHQRNLAARTAAAAARREDAGYREKARLAALSWRVANPERSKAAVNAYRVLHPEVRRVLELERRARKLESAVVKITGASLEARMAYFGNSCWICNGAYEAVDHVKPLSKGGSHMLSNLRPVCRSCNSRKHARWYGPQHLDRFVKD